MDNNTKQHTLRCWKCDSPLSPEMAIDLRSGIYIQQYACLSCGRRWYGGERPVPAIAAWSRHFKKPQSRMPVMWG